MFIRSTLFAFLFASAAAVELRGGARELETQCDCVTTFCQMTNAPVCYGYQTGTSCYAGTVDVCGGMPADPVAPEVCMCGSDTPCTHDNDGTCLELNGLGVCPDGSTNACGPADPVAPEVCMCGSDTPCTHDNDGTCLALNGLGVCPNGSTNACGPADPVAPEVCVCGSPAPCTHNNDGTCLALNALGNCPSGSTSACTCFNTEINGRQDYGCPSTGTKVCVLNGEEPAPGEGGNECVRCVSSPSSWNANIAVGCWGARPHCTSSADGMMTAPGMAGDQCSESY